jgi:hypothetical protein
MSVLSQFFPSGGGEQAKIRTNMLLVGGGGGGAPGGGEMCVSPTPNLLYNAASGGGGGGAGEVVEFRSYELTPGSDITITIGSGGAASSNGGTTCVVTSSGDVYVLMGGTSSTIPSVSTTTPANACGCLIFSTIGQSRFGGGGGATGFACRTPYPCPGVSIPTVGGNLGLVPSGGIYCGRNATTSPGASCIIDYTDSGTVIRPITGSGGCSVGRLVPNVPSPYILINGIGGGGGGGSTSVGSNRGPYGPGQSPGSICWFCSVPCYGASPGGPGGGCHISDILGSVQNFAAGGGGGGGNVVNVKSGSAPSSDCFSGSFAYRGCGGFSPTGGCGGIGGVSPRPPTVPAPVSWTPCPAGESGSNATANTGGGGGGGGAGPTTQGTGGNGGSGVVVIQYPTVYPAAPAFPGACDCSPATPGRRTYKFNGPGSITLP